jgi:hypothetical protein
MLCLAGVALSRGRPRTPATRLARISRLSMPRHEDPPGTLQITSGHPGRQRNSAH